MKLKDKVCVVTGGAMGIGEGIVNVFLKYGAKVVILDYNEEVMKQTVAKNREAGHTVGGYHVDIRDNEKVIEVIGQVINKYGQIDVLVNNAGTVVLKPFLETTIEDRDFQFDVNMVGLWQVTHATVPYMKKKGSGSIIHIGSVTGPYVCDPGMATYAMTKGAVQGFTRGLAADLADMNIRVNSIMPGYIRTPLADEVARESNPEDPESVIAGIAENCTMKRMGTIDEMGEVAAFLASEEASYLTGTSIVADGGLTIPETNGSVEAK